MEPELRFKDKTLLRDDLLFLDKIEREIANEKKQLMTGFNKSNLIAPQPYIKKDEDQMEQEVRDLSKRDAILRAIEEEHQARMDSLKITMRQDERQRMIKELNSDKNLSLRLHRDRIKREYPKANLILENRLKKYEDLEIDIYGNAVKKPVFSSPGFTSVKNQQEAYNMYSNNLTNL